MEQGHDGHRVGSTDQGAEHQRKGPRPLPVTGHYKTDDHQQNSRQKHADNQPRHGQQRGVGQGLLENMQIQLIGRIEYQHRQEDVKDEVGIDVGHPRQRLPHLGHGTKQAVAVGQPHQQSDGKQRHRIRYARTAQQRLQQSADHQTSDSQQQRHEQSKFFHKAQKLQSKVKPCKDNINYEKRQAENTDFHSPIPKRGTSPPPLSIQAPLSR